jgi:ABC-2 type transport system permease protein
MRAIYKRELLSYFQTPVGYVFMGVFAAIGGVMFYMLNLRTLSSDVLTFLGQMTFIWMLLSPVLTMRLLAEERQKRTEQLLMASPVSQTGIVLGKYLAAVTVLAAAVGLLNAYAAIILLYGKVYLSEWFIGMLGFTLQGCAFIALDLFISGLAQNQVTACVGAFGANLFVWVLDALANNLTVPAVTDALRFLSLFRRYEPFLLGQLSYASILYNLCFAAFFLAAAVWHMDMRRMRGRS